MKGAVWLKFDSDFVCVMEGRRNEWKGVCACVFVFVCLCEIMCPMFFLITEKEKRHLNSWFIVWWYIQVCREDGTKRGGKGGTKRRTNGERVCHTQNACRNLTRACSSLSFESCGAILICLLVSKVREMDKSARRNIRRDWRMYWIRDQFLKFDPIGSCTQYSPAHVLALRINLWRSITGASSEKFDLNWISLWNFYPRMTEFPWYSRHFNPQVVVHFHDVCMQSG